ncbi:MAG: hypothetical protein KA766_11835 [Piscinibacter sp.]|uniref:hypothetical protein n=1 Tax=Piscinibacter sp. TaxID=1903157 RepID=UPI001B798B33|nr:hypothetical protein [Piscinibacter sp.]MBP5990686.1 hypothetical protein [Piscinibacter sp.]
MAYTVRHRKAQHALAGFVVALPFNFNNSNHLVLLPDRAFAVLNLVLAQSSEAAYPALSQALAGRGRFELLDENLSARVVLEDFVPVRVLSSQSTDLASSHWVLGGNAATACQVQFNGVASPFPNFLADHYDHFYWGGRINDQDGTHLNLSYLEIDHDVMGQSLASLLCIGPSGASGAGSVFNRIVGQGTWMVEQDGKVIHGAQGYLSELKIEDQRRNAQAVLFGQSPQAAAQVSKATGAVFLSLGSYNRLPPAQLERLVRHGAVDKGHLKQMWDKSWLRSTSQDVARTTDDYAHDVTTQANSVFEGLTVWGLQPRQDGGKLEAKVPFLL